MCRLSCVLPDLALVWGPAGRCVKSLLARYVRIQLCHYVAQQHHVSDVEFTRVPGLHLLYYIILIIIIILCDQLSAVGHTIIKDLQCFEIFAGSGNMARAFLAKLGKELHFAKYSIYICIYLYMCVCAVDIFIILQDIR